MATISKDLLLMIMTDKKEEDVISVFLLFFLELDLVHLFN